MESFLKLNLDQDTCFLCSKRLTADTRTDEHVLPKWLQGEYNLWNKTLVLLNETLIPYRKLTIPCCSFCNSRPLARMEDQVSKLLLGTFQVPTPQQEYLLFQWCSKILYGLLRRELELVADRKDPNVGSIVPRDMLESLTTFHHFMTSIRRPFVFQGFRPYSVFAMETLLLKDHGHNFDYFDFVTLQVSGEPKLVLSLAIRVGQFGIICVLQDNGLQKECFNDVFARFSGVPLHPLQFIELACTAAYKQSLLAFAPRYHSVGSPFGDDEVVVVEANGPPSGGSWHEWVGLHYAQLFCAVAGRVGFRLPEPDKFHVNGLQSTWLYDEGGRPKRIREEDLFAPPDKAEPSP